MATQRKSTGSSPLLDMMKEVYETKLRMKKVINMVLDSNSDDFEEYSTLAYNAIVQKYNDGYRDGYNDGWHSLYPTDQLEPEDWEEGYMEFQKFNPSVPSYSTDVDVDNLTVMMTDSLRCRLLLKAALETNSDEFVTYPDILENKYLEWYDEGYRDGWSDSTGQSVRKPVIEQHGDTIQISNAKNSTGDIYYWIDDDYINLKEYTGTFRITDDCTVHSYVKHNEITSKTVNYNAHCYGNEYLTFEFLEDGDIGWWQKSTQTSGNRYYQNWIINIEYSINGGSWRSTGLDANDWYNGWSQVRAGTTITEVTAGTKIRFRRNGSPNLSRQSGYFWPSYAGGTSFGWGFESTAKYKVYGNICSMSSNNYNYKNNNISPEGIVAFFHNDGITNNTKLISAKDLVFPEYFKHYEDNLDGLNMLFYGCTMLEDAPEIPNKLYSDTANPDLLQMFKGCTSLKEAMFNLNIEWLPNMYEMFHGCTALVKAPEINIDNDAKRNDNLSLYGQERMFKGCTSLTTVHLNIPDNPGTCESMFEGCTSLTTFTTNNDSQHSWVIGNAKRMFKGCSSLVNLSPVTIQDHNIQVGYETFYECTSLINANQVKINIGSYRKDICFKMFYGCSSLKNGALIYDGNISSSSNEYRPFEYMYQNCTNLSNVYWFMDIRKLFYSNWPAFHWLEGAPNTSSCNFWMNSEHDLSSDAQRWVSTIPSNWQVHNLYND